MANSFDELTNRIIYISHKRFKIHSLAFIQIMVTSVVVALAYSSINFSMSKNIKLYIMICIEIKYTSIIFNHTINVQVSLWLVDYIL